MVTCCRGDTIMAVLSCPQSSAQNNDILNGNWLNKKRLKNVGPIRYCEPPLHCQSPGVASRMPATIAIAQAAYDVHDDDDNDNAWHRGPLWPHGMGPIKVLRPTWRRIGHTGDVLPSQSICKYWNILNVKMSKNSGLIGEQIETLFTHSSQQQTFVIKFNLTDQIPLIAIPEYHTHNSHCLSGATY